MAKFPTFNHTRADGPYDPCPECLRKMPRAHLISLVEDLQETLRELRESPGNGKSQEGQDK